MQICAEAYAVKIILGITTIPAGPTQIIILAWLIAIGEIMVIIVMKLDGAVTRQIAEMDGTGHNMNADTLK